MAAGPASASEVFIPQLTSKIAAVEEAAVSSAKTMMRAAMLALPLQPTVASSPSLPTTNAATNASFVLQIGTNNFASVTQAGGGNASVIVQRGNGNQATATQRH
jgi:hypothetical protein